MKKCILYLSVFTLSLAFKLPCQASFSDTLEFTNIGGVIKVVHHEARHYYYDSTCVWHVSYPEIIGLGDLALQSEINQMFARTASIGDCDDKECEPGEEILFPYLASYSNQVRIKCIQNNIISYSIHWESCFEKEDCVEENTHIFHELTEASEGNRLSYFKQDSLSNQKFNALIKKKLDCETEDIEALKQSAFFDFDCTSMRVSFDSHICGKKFIKPITVSFVELKPLLSPGTSLYYFIK